MTNIGVITDLPSLNHIWNKNIHTDISIGWVNNRLVFDPREQTCTMCLRAWVFCSLHSFWRLVCCVSEKSRQRKKNCHIKHQKSKKTVRARATHRRREIEVNEKPRQLISIKRSIAREKHRTYVFKELRFYFLNFIYLFRAYESMLACLGTWRGRKNSGNWECVCFWAHHTF